MSCLCAVCTRVSSVSRLCLCPVCAAQQRSWLLLQVEIDTHFLQRLNVLDYSFLLAQQPLQPDEQLQVLSLRTLISRTKR